MDVGTASSSAVGRYCVALRAFCPIAARLYPLDWSAPVQHRSLLLGRDEARVRRPLESAAR